MTTDGCNDVTIHGYPAIGSDNTARAHPLDHIRDVLDWYEAAVDLLVEARKQLGGNR